MPQKKEYSAGQDERGHVAVPTRAELSTAAAAGRSLSSNSLLAARRATKLAATSVPAATRAAVPSLPGTATLAEALRKNAKLEAELKAAHTSGDKLRAALLAKLSR